MNMDLNQSRMRYFEAVKKHRSIRKAAEQLNTTPSVITRQIQTLEDEIGTELFERVPNGMIPTDAAELLTEFWRGCLAYKENLEDQLQALLGAQSGEIQISLSEGLAESLLDEALSQFIKLYPKIQIVVNVKATNEIVMDVLDNNAHIGMAYNPPTSQYIHIHASALHRIVAAMHPKHPLARRRGSLSFQEAIQYPYGTMPVMYGIGQLIQNIAYAETLRISPAFTSNTLSMLKKFAKISETSNGISFLTDFSVKKEVANEELVAIPIDHPLLNNQYAQVFVKENRPLTRASKELLSIIKEKMSVFNNKTNLSR